VQNKYSIIINDRLGAVKGKSEEIPPAFTFSYFLLSTVFCELFVLFTGRAIIIKFARKGFKNCR